LIYNTLAKQSQALSLKLEKAIMAASEKFCLRWNDFESNISSAFKGIRAREDFFDVTLACDDDQIKAHKLILSACSPFFSEVLRRNPHPHPLLYLKGVKGSDIQGVLNFMYHGEVNVAQEELNTFLAIAEDLRVKGLTQSDASQSSQPSHKPKPERDSGHQQRKDLKQLNNQPPPRQAVAEESPDDIVEFVPVKHEPLEVPAVVHPHGKESFAIQPTARPTASNPNTEIVAQDMVFEDETNYDEYGQYQDDEYVQNVGGDWDVGGTKGGMDRNSLLKYVVQNTDGAAHQYQCTVCGKSNAQKNNVLKHIESIHFPDAFQYECEVCFKPLKSKSALYLHKSRCHSYNKC